MEEQLKSIFDDNFLTVSQSGSDAGNHFVSLLLNPESKRNKSNFECFVSRVTELQKPIGFISVEFASGDIRRLCDFLDKAIPKLIEMGSVQSSVKLYLPLSCQGKLKMLISKHHEVRASLTEHILKDVLDFRFESEFLYVDYSTAHSKLETNTAPKRKSPREGINIL